MSFSSMNGKGALIDSWYNLKQREKSGRTAYVWHLHLDNRAKTKEFDYVFPLPPLCDYVRSQAF